MTLHRNYLFSVFLLQIVHGSLRGTYGQVVDAEGDHAAHSSFCMLVCDGGSSGSRMWKFRLQDGNFQNQAKVGPNGPPIHLNFLPTAELNETGWTSWTAWLKKLDNREGCQVRIFA